MADLRVLISGASVAGPALALFLARAGAKVSIVEKAQALRTGGQNVDIRGVGLKVVRGMGLEAAVLHKATEEEGITFVDRLSRTRAAFPVDRTGRNLSMTAEVEIMRGDLAEIFYEATRHNVDYMFGNSIRSMHEIDDKVQVEFSDHSKKEFDLVIGADGLGSSTRALVFTEEKSPISPLGQYVAWFSIPCENSDGRWARWYNSPGRRMILLRPDTNSETSKITRASIWICSDSEQLKGYSRLSVLEQKALMQRIFGDAGWEAPRVLAGMASADDFYMQEVAQVKMDAWSRGRVAFVGDAAYCPSPISGMGTTVAITGAYILAEEIANNPRDHTAAFTFYEGLMRPFVTKAQKLIPGQPQLTNPQTAWGIRIMNWVLAFISRSELVAFLGKYGGPPVDGIVLPDYPRKLDEES